ncbi:MAG: ABC transporter permease subunit [Tissierellia bacterium]|nr:ABC transporter permease subunit [Tissierellia bacterium]
MGKINLKLRDSYQKEYPRKNQYLQELAMAQQKKDQEEIRRLKEKKSEHPYILSLKEYEEKEKEFLEQLKRESDSYGKKLEESMEKKLKNYHKELWIAKKEKDFYKDYVDLTYDAELKEKIAKIKLRHLPEIIGFYEVAKKDYQFVEEKRKELSKKEEQRIREEVEKYKKQRQKEYEEELKELKQKREDHIISEKSYRLHKKQGKRKYKDDITIKEYELPTKYYKNLEEALEHQFKDDVKNKEKVMAADISDARRRTPVEVCETGPKRAYFTFLFPGIGQILNGQRIKGALMLLLNLFIYGASIPYALGFGNYQGDGIAGLITLAEGGKRLDKSLIFLIEGIIAIFLLLTAVAIIYMNYRDVKKVETEKIHGIRPRNWMETKQLISDKGFPMIVSVPAFLLILFIVLIPIMTAILLSFTGMDPNHQSKFSWVGLENYKILAQGKGIAGSAFWLILGWTLIWTLCATTLAIFIGFVLALLAHNDRIKGKALLRTIYLLPWATPAFITIAFFSIMVSPTGPITQIITKITGNTILIKNSSHLTRLSLILLQGWLGSAYIFLLSTGVLQGIPSDLYEAADIDGASGFQKVFKITLPLVLFQTAPLLVGQYTFNFNNFSIIYLFNGGGPFDPVRYGNIAGSTDLLISYIYKLTMESQYQALGAAITIFISLGLMLFAFLGYRNSKAFKEEKL